MSVAAIIVAGGSGSRFGREGGKQTAFAVGRPLVARTLEVFVGCDAVDAVVVVTHPDRVDEYRLACGPLADGVIFVSGGETRRMSVAAGLAAVGPDVATILVHDGARPLVTSRLIQSVVDELADHPEAVGAVVGHPASDTVKVVALDGVIVDTPDRSRLWVVQTPQVFRAVALREAMAAAEVDVFEGTDDASVVERAGGVVRVLEGPRDNLKVTTGEDLALVEAIIAFREVEA
ncbi:MAG: 2-C-methyl-D-erythritol 4-phosphate cytidylyltransferase [Coriobacteriia bacterium]